MATGPSLVSAVETMEGEKVTVKRLFPVAGLRNRSLTAVINDEI